MKFEKGYQKRQLLENIMKFEKGCHKRQLLPNIMKFEKGCHKRQLLPNIMKFETGCHKRQLWELSITDMGFETQYNKSGSGGVTMSFAHKPLWV